VDNYYSDLALNESYYNNLINIMWS